MMPLVRETERPVRRWIERLKLAVVTIIAAALFWSGMVSMLGCWRGGGPLPTCPSGAVSTGQGGGGPVCEKPRLTIAKPRYRRVPCTELNRIVNVKIPTYDTSGCFPFFFSLEDYAYCMWQYHASRAADLEQWRTTAISVCADRPPEEP